jgi:predicted Rossmann fold flavoprotein
MKVVVIGGGAAGMLAAIFSARQGSSVAIIEKNNKLGKKLLITGKGRCNLTNACDYDELFLNIKENPKFMYSAMKGFDNKDVMAFFEALGLKLKTERGNRVFPESDHSQDVLRVLENELKRLDVKVLLNTQAKKINVEEIDNRDDIGEQHKGRYKCRYISVETNRGGLYSDACIVATGGVSYPLTGSTGDGFRFAKQLGHKVLSPYPSLIPIKLKGDVPKRLEGLSLKNVLVSVQDSDGKVQFSQQGEMIFTSDGVSGPVILTASSVLGRLASEKKLVLIIDLKPALSVEQLDARILRDFGEVKNRNFGNSLNKLLPQSLIQVIIEQSEIDPYVKVNEINREQRHSLAMLIKNMQFDIDGFESIDQAIITRGGVSTKEINPSTMESRIVKNLYFAGELIDVDAFTGGFNLQIAWSSGKLAGEMAGMEKA